MKPLEVSKEEIEPKEVKTDNRILYFDIECDDRGGYPNPSSDAVLCIGCYDTFEGEYEFFVKDGSDKELLEDFASYVEERDFDILSGWNSNSFDLPYIIRRAENIDADIKGLCRIGYPELKKGRGGDNPVLKGRNCIDLMELYNRYVPGKVDSSLDATLERELGLGKVEEGKKKSKYKLWKEDLDSLKEYNLKTDKEDKAGDVEGLILINRDMELIEFFDMLSDFSSCMFENSHITNKVVDSYLLSRVNDEYILPDVDVSSDLPKTGAFTAEPKEGVFENVIVLDLHSLYPSSIRSLNISPETLVDEVTPEEYEPKDLYETPWMCMNVIDDDPCRYVKTEKFEECPRCGSTDIRKFRFSKDKQGVVSGLIGNILEERDKIKQEMKEVEDEDKIDVLDKKQRVLKEVANSSYGVFGWESFRMFDLRIQNSITGSCRGIFKFTSEKVDKVSEETGIEMSVIYGDTDSAMISVPSEYSVKECVRLGEKLEKYLNEAYSEYAEELNAEEHYFNIELEKVYKRFFQTGKKKRYAGKVVWKEGREKDETNIVGYEYVRKTASAPITRKTQRWILEKIMEGRDVDFIVDKLSDLVKDVKNGEVGLDKMGINSSINKPLDSYENNSARAVGSIYANKYLGEKIRPGDMPKRIYIKRTGNYPDTHVVCLKDMSNLPDEFAVDYDRMIKTVLKKPLEDIIECLGRSWKDVVCKGKQATLGSF